MYGMKKAGGSKTAKMGKMAGKFAVAGAKAGAKVGGKMAAAKMPKKK